MTLRQTQDGVVATQDASGLQYLLTDHLGSTVAVVNASGTLTSQQRYLPFGAPRTILNSPLLGTDFTYTGQRKLDDGMGGIMDYKARFYSPALMRFLQADSIIPDLNNPQALNRYAYALDNPVRYNDPSGHKACEDEDENGKCVTAVEKYNKEAKKNPDAKDPKDLDLSPEGRDFIICQEEVGCVNREQPYNDGPNGTGNCTIGYGFMLYDYECTGETRRWYREHPLTKDQADEWLDELIIPDIEKIIEDTIHVNLTQSQFDALVSYIYNSGGEPGHWYIDKHIPEKLNSGHYYEAAMVIDSGPTGGNNVGYAPGLERRRHQEAVMFLYGLYP